MTARLNNAGLIVALTIWLGVLAWLAPARLILRGDDFGYVESVADTIRAHHWVPSDWLEPINLPLTALSAACFALTGNFYVSTFGLILLLAVVNFILLGRYLEPALPSVQRRWLVVLGIVLSPVWLHKTLEFTGVPLAFTCTLLAWLSWRRGWWVGFFACVVVAALNRQSALCLLAWPLVALVRQRSTGGSQTRVWLAGIVFTVGVVFAVLLAGPSTWARELNGSRLLTAFSPGAFFRQVALAVVVLVGCQAAWGVLCGEAIGSVWRANLKRPFLPLLCMSVGAWLVIGQGAGVLWETPGLDRLSLFIFAGATLAGAWLNRWTKWPATETLVFLAGYVLLVSLRGRWWDYYFIEPALALIWGTPPVGQPRSSWPAAGFLALGLAGAILFKQHLRDMTERTVAYELALRAGEVRVTELSDAPFGLLGWKLLPAARTRPDAAALIDFLKFVEGARARFRNGSFTVDREGGRKSLHPSRERWILPPDFSARPLPLDNAEWRNYLRGGAVR